MNDLVFQKNGQALTTSNAIADAFGKAHKHVLDAIRSLEIPESFGKPNFRLSEKSYINNLGYTVKQPLYEITRDGFTLLAMGFTGKKAMEFKIKYIEAFNEMERALSAPATDDVAVPKHLTFKTGYIAEATIRAFYDHYIVPEGGLMPCETVYDCFVSWCARNNKFPVSKNRFGRYLHSRGIQNGSMPKGGKAYFLTLRNDEDRPVAESPKPLPAPDPEPELDFDANPVAKKARFNSPARSSYGRWAYKFSPVLTFSGTGIYRMYNGDLFAVVECVNGDLNMVSFNPFLNRSEGQPTRAPAASFNDAVREKMCSRTELM